MAITYPLSLATFEAMFPASMITFNIVDQQILGRQGSGGKLAKDIAPAYWKIDVISRPLKDTQIDEADAFLESLYGGLGTFYIVNSRRQYPRNDPAGSTLGASTVQVNAISGNHVGFKGMPASYVLYRGDTFSVDYSSAPVKHGYFRILETGTANGSGIMGVLPIGPEVPSQLAVNDVCTFKRPVALVSIIPGSIRKENLDRGGYVREYSFTAAEVTSA